MSQKLKGIRIKKIDKKKRHELHARPIDKSKGSLAENKFCKECRDYVSCVYDNSIDCFDYWAWIYGGF